MAALFRNKSLEKLSSPEQLDKLIVINSPFVSLSLIGGAFIIIITLIWSIVGRVPITEEGQGILLNQGELTSVYSKTKGVVVKSYVSGGDKVEAGDVLYEVKSEETAEAIAILEERMQKVEDVTLVSDNDEATNDNSQLLEIKQQISLNEEGSDVSDISIHELEKQYQAKKAEASSLNNSAKAAEAAYYAAMAADNSATIEYEYTTAASEYEAAETMYQTVDSEYQKLELETENYKSRWDEAKKLYEDNKAVPEAAAQYKANVKQYQQQYDESAKALKKYESRLAEEKENRDNKKAVYEDKKAVYEAYVASAGNDKSNITKLANDYNNALSLYSSAKAEADSYETQLANARSQDKVDEENKKDTISSLKKQFDETKEAALNTLQQELGTYEGLEEGFDITAAVSGTIYTTYVANGSPVMVDTEVARINTGGEEKLYAVYYMSVASGKKIQPGMELNIYPANVPKEEYGHMKGKVANVANYVTSYADLRTKLGDESLASSFSANGAVVEVICEITKDEESVSGFKWSSKKGRTVELAEGMFLSGSVITKDAAPITMFIPKLKEKLHLE